MIAGPGVALGVAFRGEGEGLGKWERRGWDWRKRGIETVSERVVKEEEGLERLGCGWTG